MQGGVVRRSGSDAPVGTALEIQTLREDLESLVNEVRSLRDGQATASEIHRLQQETQEIQIASMEREIEALKVRPPEPQQRQSTHDSEILESEIMALRDEVLELREQLVDKSNSELELTAELDSLKERVQELCEAPDADDLREEMVAMKEELLEQMQSGKVAAPTMTLSSEDDEENDMNVEGNDNLRMESASIPEELLEWLSDHEIESVGTVLVDFGISSVQQLKDQYQSDEPTDIAFLKEDMADRLSTVELRSLWNSINNFGKDDANDFY